MLYSKIRAADYYMPSSFSDGVQDMLQALLVPHPPKRMTIEKAMNQPWFAKLRKESASSASDYLEEAMAPSDHSINTAIKPVLRQKSFQMRTAHGRGDAKSFKPKSAKSTAPKPAAAAASTSLLAEHIKIQTKKHKLAMYRNLYKD